MRASIDQRLQPLASWWTEVQEVSERERVDFTSRKPSADGIWGNKKTESASKKKRRRRRSGAKKKTAGGGDKS